MEGLGRFTVFKTPQGASFHKDLKLPQNAIIVSKGMQANQDGYSAFEGVDAEGRSLLDLLKHRKIEVLYVGGLATDYCVKTSVLDALKLGFQVHLLLDAIKGVNIDFQDSEKAISKMIENGAKLESPVKV